MHILKIIHGYPPHYNAGSEVYSQSITNQLSKSHKVSVFTREENPYARDFTIRKESKNQNLDIYLVNNPQGKDGYLHKTMDSNFKELIDDLKPDIAHIGHLNHLSTGIIDILNQKNIPILFTLHDFWLMCPRGQFLTRSIDKENNNQVCLKQEDSKCASTCYQVYFSGKEAEYNQDLEHWRNWIERRMNDTRSIINKVDHFLAPSKYLHNRFVEEFKIPTKKISYLDYGFPMDYLNIPFEKRKNEFFTFGYIGTHIPAKGINLLIEAFNQIEKKAVLKIYGRERGQSTIALKKLAKQSTNKIEFMGEYMNHKLIDEVFSQVDCIVVPSIWGENSPLVIHEAQACKTPVITANYGGMKEYVKHMENGLLFKHRDTTSIKEQLEYAIENPETMKKLGGKGYLFSDNGKVPNIKEHCETLERYYEKIK